MEDIKQLLDKFPFLTYLKYGGNEYIGIIQNVDDQITSIYDFGSLHTTEEKKRFLELGETWWWESNRKIPVNVFLKTEWQEFRASARTMISKDVEIVYGPQVSLKEMLIKKSKRRAITLVKKVK